MQAILKILKDNPDLIKKIGLVGSGVAAGGAIGKGIDLASDELSGRNSLRRGALRAMDKVTSKIDVNALLERMMGK